MKTGRSRAKTKQFAKELWWPKVVSNNSNLQSPLKFTEVKQTKSSRSPQQAAAVAKLRLMWHWAKVKASPKLETVGAAHRFSYPLLCKGYDAYLLCWKTWLLSNAGVVDPKYELPTHKHFSKVAIPFPVCKHGRNCHQVSPGCGTICTLLNKLLS